MSNIKSPNNVEVQALGYGAGSGGVLEKCCIAHPPERVATRPRNLVVCIDGTSNKFGQNNSNVVELYSRLVKDESQLTYYNSGIGTFPKPSWKSFSYYKKKTAHVIDMAIAWWFEKRIMEAYRWLSDNYREGDRLFLFGFSRGAYQVRVLSAMIEMVGLIHRGNDDQIPFAYELYSKCTDPMKTLARQPVDSEASHFRKTFSREVKVHFVGAWDTVSSVGLFPKTLPLTTTGMDYVCFFRHALALDERRVNFVPEYAGGQTGSFSYPQAQNRLPPPKKEVWFAGTHSDIGGGAAKNEELTSNGPALRWMIRESIEAGLSLSPFSGQWSKVYGKLDEIEQHSPSRLWIPLEILPGIKSVVPHLGERRQILLGQQIHQSVYASNSKYTKRLPVQLQGSEGDHVEQDKFDAVASKINQCVEDLKGCRSDDKESVLKKLPEVASKDGRLAYQDLFESLKTAHDDTNKTQAIAKMEILCHVASITPKGYANDIPLVVRNLLCSEDPKNMALAGTFITKFAHVAGSFKIYLNADIKSLAISKGRSFNSQAKTEGGPCYLAVASAQTAIPIYDLSTGQIIQTLGGHTKQVESVSFSPSMANLKDLVLVSGSTMDGTIRVWDVAHGLQWESTNAGHKGGTLSVAFSSDGKQVVSGGLDCSPSIWKVESDARKLTRSHLFEGHTSRVFSATISPGGSRLVSVSKDNKIFLWNCEEEVQIGTGIKRGPNDPKEVIFLSEDYFLVASSDGKFTARHSTNHSLELSSRIELPQGVSICTLGFHKDKLACGLSDGCIVIWTVQLALLKEKRLEFIKQHTYDYHLGGHAPSSVTSIVFSDDLERLVAGYGDGYVVVWYARGMEGVLDELSDGQGVGSSGGADSFQHERLVFYSAPDNSRNRAAPYESDLHSEVASQHSKLRFQTSVPKIKVDGEFLEDLNHKTSTQGISLSGITGSAYVPSSPSIGHRYSPTSTSMTHSSLGVHTPNTLFPVSDSQGGYFPAQPLPPSDKNLSSTGASHQFLQPSVKHQSSRTLAPPSGGTGSGNACPSSGGADGHSAQPPLSPGQEGFDRPNNGAPASMPSKTIRIHDMDDFGRLPLPMPTVIRTYGVDAKDWTSLVEELALAWSGQIPAPTAPHHDQPLIPLAMIVALLFTWNKFLFNTGEVNLVLYKGHECCSGPRTGQINHQLPIVLDDQAEDSSTESEDVDSDIEDEAHHNAEYGRAAHETNTADVQQSRSAKQSERKHRGTEEKKRKRAQATAKYTLYLTCPEDGAQTADHAANIRPSSPEQTRGKKSL
ncbi:hypothetical protein PM082_023558 [Marasmius tenuissimus]|nr:hypothetical protein PM082_023558 [Marasmius tenuissimus]